MRSTNYLYPYLIIAMLLSHQPIALGKDNKGAGSLNQKEAQEQASEDKSNASDMLNMISMGLNAVGTVMLMSPDPATQKKGKYFLAGGMVASLVGMSMGQKSKEGKRHAGDLGPGSTKITPPSSSSRVDSPDHPVINRALTELSKKTGATREELINALQPGGDPIGAFSEYLENPDQIRSDVASAASQLENSGGAMNQLLAEAGLSDLSASSGTSYTGGGRGIASKGSAPSFDFKGIKNMLGQKNKKLSGKLRFASKKLSGKLRFASLSPGLQKALVKKGHNAKTLFEIVHSRYNKMSPMLLGHIPQQPQQ